MRLIRTLAAAALISCLSICSGQLLDEMQLRVNATDSRVMENALYCPCSPSGRGYAAGARASLTGALRGSPDDAALLPAYAACAAAHSHEDCVNADAALRAASTDQLCTYDSASGRNLYDDADDSDDMLRTVAACDSHPSSRRAGPALPSGGEGGDKGSGPRNEGCVAVEHLKGFAMQYRAHLRRRVMCAGGFCATPNHAIIVVGQWTSMKRMCTARWRCVWSVRMVNNLRISRNRRAEVGNDIVVTPYDLRFPRAAAWAVQMAGDVLEIVVSALAAGVLAAIMVLLHGMDARRKGESGGSRHAGVVCDGMN